MTLTIDGRTLAFAGRRTLLEVATANGIYVPSLCDHPGLEPYAACRLCLVEVKGRRGYVPACSTIAEDGLEVVTATPELMALRRGVLELILAEHPHACLICAEKTSCDDLKSTIRKTGEVTGCVLCPVNGRCELQKVVGAVGIERVHLPAARREGDVRRDDPFIDRDNSLCILCGRCIRVCHEVRGASVLTFVSRGSKTFVGTALDRRLVESGCRFCGACVDVCPTGSLEERAVRYDRLPDAKGRTICPLCGQGCGLVIGLRQGRVVGAVPDTEGAVNRGQACVKGRFLTKHIVSHPSRLLKPLVRRDGHLREVLWEEALDEAARRLAAISTGKIGVASSGQSSCEDLFVLRRFARDVLKSEMTAGPWAESAAGALTQVARAAGQAPPLAFRMSEIGQAQTIMVLGEDLPVTQPILGLAVHRAVRNGASVIGVGTDGRPGSPRSTLSLSLPPGTETAFLLALAASVMKTSEAACTGSGDQAGIRASLRGFDVPKAAKSLGISEERLREISRLLTAGRPPVFLVGPAFLAASGLRALAILWNLAVLSGGRLLPLDDQANLRGGLALFEVPTGEMASAASLSEALARREVQALYLAGPFPKLAPGAAPLVIFQGSFLEPNAEAADIVLPEATSFETEGTLVNIEGRLQVSGAAVPPGGEVHPGWAIVTSLASRMGASGFIYESAAEVRRALAGSVAAFAPLATESAEPEGIFLAEKAGEINRLVDLKTISERAGRMERSRLNDPDTYKGLDLVQESKSLRIVRGR